MKFLKTFSAVLCVLSLGACAVPTAGLSSALEIRTTTQTQEYEKAHAAKPDIEDGKRYAFALKSGKDATQENPKMKQLTDELGFGHIYLVVGEVSKKPSGLRNHPTNIELGFTAVMYHMDGIDRVRADHKNWKADGGKLEFVKETTKAKSDRLKRIGRRFSDGF
ncbi:hypothetical protein MMC17_005993 [Xylographa soralifera]|nr:hypothetical protein [Xylographa soralifera]